MTTLLSILFLGFFLGMRHATDADHVIAITTIVSRQRNVGGAALTGIFWGIGHTLTLVVVGGAIILFGLVIPERLGLSFEFCVALMLIFLGTLNLRSIKRGIQEAAAIVTHDTEHSSHAHPHQHGDYVHEHVHGHAPGKHGHAENAVPPARLDRCFGRLGIYPTVRPIVIGVVHGLAGSAAVALLVLPIIHDPVWALAYLLIFGAGTIAGMMLITAAIAVPITYTANRFQSLNRYLGATAGVLSVAFGIFLVYQIGFVNGLFTH
ncbi:MAG: high-affinity nickel-transport family protein [Verrucomicrobiota bacterium]|nr:high-affinity nickel-transport family protein [Verrucomicrobiota bacterium]